MDEKQNSADSTTIFTMPTEDATIPDLMASARPNHPTLSIVKGPNTGMTFVLDTPQITIGRDPSNEVFLNDMTVSRHHATLHLDQEPPYVEDLGSLNGTWVDGAIVNKSDLEDGSTIQIGTFRMVFHTTHNTSKINVG